MLTIRSPQLAFPQDGGDPAAACSCFIVLRECVAAKSAWRSANIARMIDFGATEILASTAVDAFQRQALSEVGAVALFWTLSALATKGVSTRTLICILSFRTSLILQTASSACN